MVDAGDAARLVTSGVRGEFGTGRKQVPSSSPSEKWLPCAGTLGGYAASEMFAGDEGPGRVANGLLTSGITGAKEILSSSLSEASLLSAGPLVEGNGPSLDSARGTRPGVLLLPTKLWKSDQLRILLDAYSLTLDMK